MDTPVDPYEIFVLWFTDAEETEPRVPNAVAVATADAQGRPSVRQVLLKAWDERGFVFYTNLGSRKGRELAENPWAALNFHWKTRMRQVQVRGRVEQVSDEQADAYFKTRARASRIGAWASKQSQPMGARGEFEKRIAKYPGAAPVEITTSGRSRATIQRIFTAIQSRRALFQRVASGTTRKSAPGTSEA